MNILKTFVVALCTFIALDMLWIGVLGKNLYNKYLGYLLAPSISWWAVILFYVLYIVGLIYFVISPALSKDQLFYAVKAGMLFGLITYATYDLTNLATIEGWPLAITFIDLAWGTFLGGSVSTLSYIILKRIL